MTLIFPRPVLVHFLRQLLSFCEKGLSLLVPVSLVDLWSKLLKRLSSHQSSNILLFHVEQRNREV